MITIKEANCVCETLHIEVIISDCNFIYFIFSLIRLPTHIDLFINSFIHFCIYLSPPC